MTDFPHTHVRVDAITHKISRVEAHGDGPGHTHRVHLGCGLTIDTDLGGVLHAAKAAGHRERAVVARDQGHDHVRVDEERRAANASLLSDKHALDHAPGGRWSRIDSPAADCPGCSRVEAGAAPASPPPGHAPPSTVLADEFTGVRCPSCAGEIRRRRRDGAFACTGSGHEFSAADLLARTGQALSNLIELAKG